MIQMTLPAGWAREVSSLRDPQAQLDELARDKLDAKVEIRNVLERLAAKHGVRAREVNATMRGYVDDALADLAYEVERTLVREVETASDD